jgi:hypothetical protein
MTHLLHITPDPDGGPGVTTTVAITELGAAIYQNGSVATLLEAGDVDEALSSAAALVTREADSAGGSSAGATTRHYLLVSSDATVLHNGTALNTAGIAALSRRDEIFVSSEIGVRRYYFSDEVIPEPEAVPADLSEDACCPRCQRSLHVPSPTADGLNEDDDPTISRKPLIRCGGCGSLYHAHGCYDYEPTCLICLSPTTGHKLWTPEELD